MRFELLQQRVERAELRVAGRLDEAHARRGDFGQAWRQGWSPARILTAGLLSGFLVGRAEPLSRIGGMRWLQMLGTVSSLLTTLQAAADAAQEATAPSVDEATAREEETVRATAPASSDEDTPQPPAPAEAATEVSER